MQKQDWWSVPRLWAGATAFVVAGGPSVLKQNTAALRGRRAIAINSAWRTVPFADVLLFGDGRWWRQFGKDAAAGFGGVIVTTCPQLVAAGVRNLSKSRPPQPAFKPTHLTMNKTTVTAGIDYARHSGATRVVLLGVDGRLGEGGRRHHHGDKYPWPLKPDSFADHAKELSASAPLFAAVGLEIFNASPVSKIKNIPNADLKDFL